MSLNRADGLSSLLRARLPQVRLGILVRGVEGIDPVEIKSSLADNVSGDLWVAASGYWNATLPGIEEAVEWRGHVEKAGRILVFVRTDAPKMHSLADLTELTSRDIAKQLCAIAETRFSQNNPTERFWKTLATFVDTIPLTMLEDYLAHVVHNTSEHPQVGEGLWRIGFLPDRRILDAGIANVEDRLTKNRVLLSKISQLSEESRKRLSAALVEQGSDAAELKNAYRLVMSFFRRGDANLLQQLDYSLVERLLEAGKRVRPTPPPDVEAGDTASDPAPDGPLRGERLAQTTAELFLDDSDEAQATSAEIASYIHDVLNGPNAPSEISPSGLDQAVQFKPSQELQALNRLMGLACADGVWGGTLETTKADIKSAVKNAGPDEFQPFCPDDPQQGSGGQSVFALLRQLDPEADGTGSLSRAIELLGQHRSELREHLSLLLANPLTLFRGYPGVVESLKGYLASYGSILHALNKDYSSYSAKGQLVTEFVCQELLRLDVVHIKTPTEWKAILTPLHPFHLWRFREIINSLPQTRDCDEEELLQLKRVLPHLPHLLHFVVFSPAVAPDVHLPQSGTIELLPTYENKTNRYLGLDGLETIPNLLNRWVDFAPYSKVDVKLSVVDPPDIPVCVQKVREFLKGERARGLSLNIYLGRGQDPTAEMLRLDLVGDHEDIGQLIADGRLRIRMESFTTLPELSQKLAAAPSHIVFAFDQSHYQLGNTAHARDLVVSPLVVTYEYTFDGILKIGEIAPSSEAHDGLFADYHFLVKQVAQLPAGQQLRLKTQIGETVASINELLKSDAARWLVVADRVLTPYAPANAVPLTEQRVGNRELGVWASKESYAVQRLVQLLRRYNLNPNTQVVAELLRLYGHIAASGILSLPLVGGNTQSREVAEKGLLGTLIGATWYQAQYPGSLVAALDSSLARDWLCKRHPDRTERADLIGIRTDGEHIIVEPIEVKSRKDEEAAHVSRAVGSRTLVGKAIDQLESMIEVLEPIFGLAEPQALFTAARREALKYQLYRECFRDSHDAAMREAWFGRLKHIFAEHDALPVEVRGLALHVVFEESGADEHHFDPDRPLRLTRLRTGTVQRIVAGLSLVPPVGDPGADGEPILQAEGMETPGEEGDGAIPQGNVGHGVGTDTLEPSQTTEHVPTATAGPSIVVAATTADPEQARELSRQFRRACNAYNVQIESCDPERAVLGPTVWRFYVRLKAPQTLGGLRGKLEDIGREMGRSGLIVTSIHDSRDIALDIPRRANERERVNFTDYLPHLPTISSIEQLPLLIGVTPEGEHITRDLSTLPHLLVGGTTGSGKSVFLYSLLLSLLARHPQASGLQIMLSSSKSEDFVFFAGLPQLLSGSVIDDAAVATQTLQAQVVQEMQRRKELFEGARCRDIIQYNQRNTHAPVAPWVVVVDEFADLADQFGSNRAAKEAFYTAIRQIAQAGRSRGIHLVLCTQRPSADLVPTNLRSLMNGRVALCVNDGIASKMILDENGAENLQRHGDMLFKENALFLRAQGYFVSTEDIERFLGL